MKKAYQYGIGAGAALFLCAALLAHAAVPAVINYQSRLRTVAGAPITTATRVSFSLYSVATGGSALWTESYNAASGACAKITPDANGYFSVQMGSCAAFPASLTFTTPLYLGVTVGSDAEATPRVPFSPAPYALNSVRVGNFISDTAANTLTGEPVGTATVLSQNKNSSALVLQGSAWNGSAAATKDFKLQVTPTSASNYRFGIFDNSGGSELVSVLNNGNVGIGTTAPTETLHVAGTARITDTVTTHSIMPDGDNLYDLGTHSNRFRTGYFKDVVYGDTVKLGSENNTDYVKFTLPKFFISASSTTSDTQVQLAQFEPTGITFLENTAFNKLVSVPARQIKFGLNTFTFPVGAPASDGLVLTTDTDGTLSWTSKSAGSVTSVGLSAPTDFTVSGTPVTSSGSLGLAWKNQSANDILAGPASGAAGTPSFRSLVAGDIPNLDAGKITTGTINSARLPVLAATDIPNLDASKITFGTFGVARGGTGLNTYAKGQIVYSDAINSLAGLGIGSVNQVLVVDATGVPAWKNLPSDAGGTVKSVGFTAPSIFSVIGTPITDSGTIALGLAPQAKNEVFVGPASGVNAAPTFRALTAADIPNLDAAQTTAGTFNIARIPSIPAGNITGVFASSTVPNLDAGKITSGVFAAARIPNLDVVQGGTGITSNAKGDILYGDAINSLATLGIGSTGQVLSVNAAGLPVWSAPATSGTVTSVSATVPSVLTVAGSPVTGAGTLAFDLSSQASNEVFAGPLSGANAKPSFRSLAAADIPSLDAAKITTGIIGIGRIPDLDAAKVTSGVFAAARIPTLAASQIPDLDASKITTGTIDAARLPAFSASQIPDLDAAKITSGTFNIARIPAIPAGSVTGTLAVANVPDLDASKIISGVFNPARIPVVSSSSVPNLDASKITSGTFGVARGGTGLNTYAKGQIVYSDAINSLAGLGIGSNGTVLTANSVTGLPEWKALPASGVTSVAATVPSFLTVSGSPITATGTLAFDLATQAAGTVFTGPASGVNTAPSFRSLVSTDIPNLDAAKITTGSFSNTQIPNLDASKIATGLFASSLIPNLDASKITTGTIDSARLPALAAADIPNLDAAKITTGVFNAARIPAIASSSVPNLDASKITTGSFGVARGGTGITSNAKGDILYGDAINSLATLGIGSTGQVLSVNAAGLPVWGALPASGVTSVGLSLPSIFNVAGTPVTASGTIAATLATQTANTFFAGPSSGAATAPSFRSLAAADIPNLDASQVTTGIFSAARIPAVSSSSIPDLDAAKITTGIFNIARIPNIPAANVVGTFASSSVPSLDASKITSGIFGVARGGTGLSSVGANGTVLTVSGGVPAWQAVPAGLSGTGTFGQLAFWSASSTLSGNPKLIIDNTNSRLAIGTSASPATTLVVGGDTTIGGDVVPSAGSSFDLGSATKHIRNAYIDDLFIYGGGGAGTSTISATQTVFNGVAYNWPSGGLGNNFVLTTDTNGNLGWQNPTNLVPESGFRGAGGIVRLGVISDKVGIGTATPATKLDVVGDIQASGYLSSASGQIKFGGATYAFPTTLPSAGQVLTASSSGTLAWQAPASGIGGSGTINSLPVFTASGTLGNSLIAQSGNEVQILNADFRNTATTSLAYLNVGNTARLQGNVHLGSGANEVVGVHSPATFDSMITVNGSVLFSNPNPGAFVRIAGTNLLQIPNGAGAGKVLTSDATGNATWQAAAAGGLTAQSGSNINGFIPMFNGTNALVNSNMFVKTDGTLNIGANSTIYLGQTGGQDNVAVNTQLIAQSGFTSKQAAYLKDVSIGNASQTGVGSLTVESGSGIAIKSNPGVGRVLTSDASGNATWQIPAATDLQNIGVVMTPSTDGTLDIGTTAKRFGILHAKGVWTDNLTTYQQSSLLGGVTLGNVVTDPINVIGKLSIPNAGTPGMGKVLTSDATGVATWQAPAAGGSALSGTVGKIPYFNTSSTLASSFIATTATTTAVASGIMPSTDNVYDLGSPTQRWRSVYVGPSTIHITDASGNEVGGLGAGTGVNVGKIVAKYGATEVPIQTASAGITLPSAIGSLPYVSGSNTLSSSNISFVGGNATITSGYLNLGGGTTGVPIGFISNDGSAKLTAANISDALVTTLRVQGGSPAAGKVLTSDIQGNATWQSLPASSGSGIPASVPAGTALLSPIGSAGAPAFRALTALDIPTLDASKITTGALPVTNGGTGLSSVGTNGQILTVVNGLPAWTTPAASGGSSGNITGTLSVNSGYRGLSPSVAQNNSLFTGAVSIQRGNTGLAGSSTDYYTTPSFIVYDINNQPILSLGTTSGPLTILPGSAGVGKVLTSDAAGNATWQSPAAGGAETGTYAGGDKTISNGSLNVYGSVQIVGPAGRSFAFQSSAANGNAFMNVLGLASNDAVSLNQPLSSGGNLNIRNSNSSAKISFQIGGSEKYLINSSGASSVSDRRLKGDISELSGVLSKLDLVHGVNFTWNDDKTKKKQLGVIAQDVEGAFPEIVTTDKETGFKSVNYGSLAAVAIQGVKELNAKMDAPVTHAILPAEDNVYDLGSPTNRFRSLYIGPHSVHFMNDAGEAIGTLDVPDGGENKGKVVVNVNGKETVLGGGGSCGTLCAVLTAKVENGKASLVPAVPDVDLGSAATRLKAIFAETANLNGLSFAMAGGDFADAAVGKALGIVSVEGGVAKVGLVDAAGKDDRVDPLVTDMAQAKNDIAMLKAQLAQVQAALAVKAEKDNACRSESIPVPVTKAVGSGDWTVTPLTVPAVPVIKQLAPLIQV